MKHLGVALLVLIFSYLAQASPLGYKERRLQLGANTSYFTTNSNINDNGNLVGLSGSNTFQVNQFDLWSRYDFSNYFSMQAALGVGYAQSVTGNLKRTNLGTRDITLSADYFLGSFLFDFVPEVIFTSPLNSISDNTDDVMIGEASTDVEARLNLAENFPVFKLNFYGGFKSRGGGRSSFMTYGGVASLHYKSFQLGGGVDGYMSVTDDVYVKTPSVRNSVTSRVAGGSYRYYSVNPSTLDASGFIGFAASDNSQIKLGGGYTLIGSRVASGLTLFAQFIYSFDPEKTFGERSRVKEVPVMKKSDEFQIEQNTREEESLYLDKVHNPKKTKLRESRTRTGDGLDQKVDSLDIQLNKTVKKKKKKY